MIDQAQNAALALLQALKRYKSADMEQIYCQVPSRLPLSAKKSVRLDGWYIGEVRTRSSMYPVRKIHMLADGRLLYDHEYISFEEFASMGDVLNSIVALMNDIKSLTIWESSRSSRESLPSQKTHQSSQNIDLRKSAVATYASYYAGVAVSDRSSPEGRKRLNVEASKLKLSKAEQEIGNELGYVISSLTKTQYLRDSMERLTGAIQATIKPSGDDATAEQGVLNSLLNEVKRQYERELRGKAPDDDKAERAYHLANQLNDLKYRATMVTNLSYVTRSNLKTRAARRLSRYQRWNMPHFMVKWARTVYVQERIPIVQAQLDSVQGYIHQADWDRIQDKIESLEKLIRGDIPIDETSTHQDTKQDTKPPTLGNPCPVCRGTLRDEIRPGVFLCLSQRLVGATPPTFINPTLGVMHPQPIYQQCGTLYKYSTTGVEIIGSAWK